MRPPGSLLPIVCGADLGRGEGGDVGCQRSPVVAADSLSAACPDHPDVVLDLTPPAPVDLSGLILCGPREVLGPEPRRREPHADRRRT